MALIRLILALTMLVMASGAVAAGIELREFDDPVKEKRYHDLTSSMRCPLCENQAIDDSDAPISADMRERVYRLIEDGQSDTEIINHMVQRFGEYILYNPRLENRTYLLWGLPFALVLLGVVIVVLMIRARRHASAKALSAEERQRIDALINRKGSS
ncbi:cytochrome c-type biogenesis protein [Halovibrio sp. HP20-50]|uniref:cytochrome c-type biogenesis protein n=1 Tax=Halovibrio sp. HP20-59 TaxID=3080275 RepID=UPI00294AA608|nr:cytochrome c-type biogenesis protein [Halovibrio sp. HP20-59]MEA2118939.1 cytochrome c-type biogenesis protein [Halovibrio sp. HP20-59]